MFQWECLQALLLRMCIYLHCGRHVFLIARALILLSLAARSPTMSLEDRFCQISPIKIDDTKWFQLAFEPYQTVILMTPRV